MSDDGPLLSQSTSYYAMIFVYRPDDPIPVFVEASSVRNRPKLIRSLRNSGALIRHDPAQAHIILVDSTTDAGTQFIRDWGTDPAKFVLEYSWARKSIEAGRPLLQNDNWGDCMAHDDGRSISGADDGEGPTAKSPLPTPRPTPSDAESSSTKHGRSQPVRQKPDTEGQAADRSEDQVEPSSSRSTSQVQQIPQIPQFQQTSQQMPQSQQFPYPASQSQQFTYPQQTPQPQQFQPQVFAQQYPPSQPSQSNSFLSNTGIQFPNTFPTNPGPQMQQFPQSQTGQGMAYPPQMMQNYMGQPNGQQTGPYDVQRFWATFIDVARQQGLPMPLGVPQQMSNNMMPHMLQSQQFQNNGMQSLGQGQSTSSSFPDSLANGSVSNSSSHVSPSAAPHSSSPEMCAPSIRRRSLLPTTPSPPPPPTRSKGKEKATGSRRNSFKRKRSVSSDEPSDEEDLFVTPPRNRQAKEPQVLSPRKLGDIFRSDSGENLLFFVQVDLMGRHGIVQSIKKNGGKMGGSISDADYVVLGNTLSKTFPDLLAQTTAANKLPLRSAFIVDCVKHEALLDINDYVLEEYVPPKKRGRPNVIATKAEKAGKPKEKKESNRPTTNKRTEKPMVPIRHTGPPSPTPPPVSTRVALPGGHFRFSDEEVNFFRRYARHLLEMDHQISNTAIFKRLYEKMPHHSSQSWQGYIRRCFPDDLDIIRKKVGIARRKAADAGSNSQVDQVDQIQDEAGPSNRALLSPPDDSMLGVEATLDPQQHDFQVITRFFASGGGDNSDDEAVWESLAAHEPCRSAASWPEYYQSQEGGIMKEIERLIEEEAGEETGKMK